MQRNINSLIGYTIGASDGKIGSVEEFYFDDETWAIRYLVVQAGNWFSGRRVLISPEALLKGNWTPGVFSVNLTKEQIRTSPNIDTDKPVYRQHEMQLNKHYGWQNYWPGSGFWDIPHTAPPYADGNAATQVDGNNGPNAEGDSHLRATSQITGCIVNAKDGEAGNVDDFIMDDETWRIIYLMVGSDGWFDNKKVPVPVTHITAVEWVNSTIYVDITVDDIKNNAVLNKTRVVNAKKEDSFSVSEATHNL